MFLSVHASGSRRLRSTRKLGFFQVLTSGFVPGFSLAWFDSGYIFASVCEGLFLFPKKARRLSSVVRQSRIWFGGRCPCCAGRVPCPLLCSTSAHGSDPAEFRGDAAVAVSSRFWRPCVHAARCSVLSRIRVRGSCWAFFAPQAVFAVGADFEWLHVDLLRVARCPRYVGAESLGVFFGAMSTGTWPPIIGCTY